MAFKICLIGCGNIAVSQHGPAIKKYESMHPDTYFSSCCDINEERAKSFKEKFKLDNCYVDIDTMLETEKPDAVSLNAPVEKTAELAIQILNKGFPLILEKPPGLTADENKHMRQSAGNVPNMVAFNRRHMPLVQKSMDLLHETGAKIMDIQYRMLRVNRRDAAFSTTAIHGIDLVRHMAESNYETIHFRYKELPEYGDTVANFHLYGETESGVIVHLDFLPMSGVNTERLEINTDKGLFLISLPIWDGCYDGAGRLIYLKENKEQFLLDGTEAAGSGEEFVLSGFYGENKRFFDDIRNKRKPEGDIKSGMQAVEIAEYINERKSSYRFNTVN